MANEYTPTVWRTGDIITAEKLNKIEEGIANAGQPSSDLSIAEVTLVSSSAESYSLIGAAHLITLPMATDKQITANPVHVSTNDDYTAEIVMYKNYAEMYFDTDTLPTVVTTGNVTYDSETGYFEITGDCTITIS